MHVSYKLVFLLFLEIYLRMELLNHMVVLFSVFKGTSILFSIVTEQVYIPNNSVKGSLSSIFSLTFLMVAILTGVRDISLFF